MICMLMYHRLVATVTGAATGPRVHDGMQSDILYCIESPGKQLMS